MAGFALPTINHPARELMGDIAHVAEVLNPENVGRLPDFAEAVRNARRTLDGCKAAKSVNCICIRGDDERWLIQVGKRGGWKRLWNFGRGR